MKNTYFMSIILGVMSFTTLSMGIFFLIFDVTFLLEYTFFVLGSLSFNFIIFLDSFSLMFFGFVSMISSSVFIYSESYMNGDKNKYRFIILVFFFVISMFFMVFSLNLISIMLGWDGLGVTSYILVIYYENEKSNGAGMITSLSNRIGDGAIMVAIALFAELGSFNFLLVQDTSSPDMNVILGGMMILAASTKSAQIPFSAWLPAAMAAPTPVSALVHSSTLVTAGVYLLIRFQPLINGTNVLFFMACLGILTTVLSSLSALFETDMKKVVALSTLSQLGVMIVTVSMGLVKMAYFHMLAHAVFKALLFMCSGKIIHCSGGNQDLRGMGSFSTTLPFTNLSFSISNMALCGLPFLTGFYSKDSLLETLLMQDMSMIYLLGYFLVVGLSSSYSIRLFIYSFMSKEKNKATLASSSEDFLTIFSGVLLLILSVVGGSLLSCLLFPEGLCSDLPWNYKLFVWVSMMSGIFMGLMMSFLWNLKMKTNNLFFSMENFMSMWNLPSTSGKLPLISGFGAGLKFKKMDLGWNEHLGGQGINFLLMNSNLTLLSLQVSMFKKFILIFISSMAMFVVVKSLFFSSFVEYNIEAIEEKMFLKKLMSQNLQVNYSATSYRFI